MSCRRPLHRVAVLTVFLAAVTSLALAPSATALRLPLWTDTYAPTVEIDHWNDSAVGPGHTLFVCGTQGLAQVPGARMTVAKYDSSGKRAWQTATVPGVAIWAQPGADAQGYALAVDHAGDVVVVGSSSAPDGGYAVVKFDGIDGQVLWAQDVRLDGAAWAEDVVVDADNAVYVTGTAYVDLGSTGTGHAIVTWKLSSSGHERWLDVWSGPMIETEARALVLDGTRNVYVCGVDQSKTGGTDIVLHRIRADGWPSWARRWDGPEHRTDLAAGLVRSSSGALYVVGTTQVGLLGRQDGVLLRYTPGGERQWVRYLRRPATATDVMDLCRDSAGDLLLCGQRRPLDANEPTRALLAKYSPNGRRRWLRDTTAPGIAAGAMAYYDVARGPSGSMYLAGAVVLSTTGLDVLVERRRAGGGLSWRAVYAAPGGDDRGGPLVVDGARAVYVCCSIEDSATFLDAALQKYKP